MWTLFQISFLFSLKKLEELGIGRPSTYAPTISTILNRGYVEKGTVEGTERKYVQLVLEDGKISDSQLTEMVGSEKGKIVPTDIGMIVNDFLVTHFTKILDFHRNRRKTLALCLNWTWL